LLSIVIESPPSFLFPKIRTLSSSASKGIKYSSKNERKSTRSTTDPSLMENNKKISYAKILSRREKNVKQALDTFNLSSKFKWEMFVITLTESNNGRVFNNTTMKPLAVYKAALHYGFTEEEIAGAKRDTAKAMHPFIQ
ncbi:Uncharacterized protein FKW44_013980, partial [Caligus rogercresseyi]